METPIEKLTWVGFEKRDDRTGVDAARVDGWLVKDLASGKLYIVEPGDFEADYEKL
jgi:hypothetical protein